MRSRMFSDSSGCCRMQMATLRKLSHRFAPEKQFTFSNKFDVRSPLGIDSQFSRLFIPYGISAMLCSVCVLHTIFIIIIFNKLNSALLFIQFSRFAVSKRWILEMKWRTTQKKNRQQRNVNIKNISSAGKKNQLTWKLIKFRRKIDRKKSEQNFFHHRRRYETMIVSCAQPWNNVIYDGNRACVCVLQTLKPLKFIERSFDFHLWNCQRWAWAWSVLNVFSPSSSAAKNSALLTTLQFPIESYGCR